MSKIPAEHKHLAYLVQGRVQIVRLGEDSCLARVRGSDSKPYEVHGWHGHWTCSCPARVTKCAHIRAVCLVVKLRPAEGHEQGEQHE